MHLVFVINVAKLSEQCYWKAKLSEQWYWKDDNDVIDRHILDRHKATVEEK